MKLGYYSLLDTALIMRQLYSGDRFRPFNAAVKAIEGKLNEEDQLSIMTIGSKTNGWLLVIEYLMAEVFDGITSPEELLIKAQNRPDLIFGPHATLEMVTFFTRIWSQFCFSERAKQQAKIMSTASELARHTSVSMMVSALAKRSDRLTVKENRLTLNIQPRFSINIEAIENMIVMPSVFSTRQVDFWYKDQTLVFFVATTQEESELIGPSDMVMLRTLAVNDKTRLKMLKVLNRQAMSVNEIAEHLNINASTASRHLKIFKDVGFVELLSKDRNSQYYILNQETLKKGLQSINDYVIED